MNIGNKILELRKEKRLSQEQLAEKIGVTRQTISNWELGETSPDLNQAKDLVNVFDISLDELIGNNTNDLMLKKVSSVEKNTTKIQKFIKIILIVLLVMFIYNIICEFAYINLGKSSGGSIEFTCNLNGEENEYYFEYANDKNFKVTNYNKNGIADEILGDISKYNSITEIKNKIENYYKTNGGTCE